MYRKGMPCGESGSGREVDGVRAQISLEHYRGAGRRIPRHRAQRKKV